MSVLRKGISVGLRRAADRVCLCDQCLEKELGKVLACKEFSSVPREVARVLFFKGVDHGHKRMTGKTERKVTHVR